MRTRLETLFDLLPTLNSRLPTYRVKVKTGNQIGAGTRSTIFLTVIGKLANGDIVSSDEILLDHPYITQFERVRKTKSQLVDQQFFFF